MGAFLVFVIKANLALVFLYLIYKWLLAGRKMYRFNRKLLLAFYMVAPLSVGLPSLWRLIGHAGKSSVEGLSARDLVDMMLLYGSDLPAELSTGISIPYILLWIWIVGMIIAAGASAVSMMRLRRIIRSGDVEDTRYGKIVVTDRCIVPFSIGKTIVISREDMDDNGEMILTHEAAHIARHHMLDLLCAQLFIIIGWFNPATWLIADELRDIHEFQADEAVIMKGFSPSCYQMLLIRKAVGTSFPTLANSLNHSNLKKRITMMQKSDSKGMARLKALALLPALAGAIAITAIPSVASSLNRLAGERLINVAEDKPVLEVREDVSLPDTQENGIIASENDGKISENNLSDKEAEDENISVDEQPEAEKDVEEVIFKVDGKTVTREELEAIDSGSILSMQVDKSGPIPVVLITTKESAANRPFFETEKKPEFPGGTTALLTWIGENIRYPGDPEEDGDGPRRVIVKFVVGADGKVRDPKVVKGAGEKYDAEALRVISNMPDWQPGESQGKKVATYYTLPITFKAK